MQPYGAPQEYGQPAEGIALTTRFFPVAFTYALTKPKVVVDGYQVPVTGWGRTVLPARPGPHHVHVHIPYLLPKRLGSADTFVEVYPGRLVELEYKAPAYMYFSGSLGSPPQSYKGAVLSIGVIVVALLLPVVAVLLGVVLASH